ncbi:MAG: coproporphyrinogen dehydrogenase HemZ [Clostridia bacterium]
MIEFSITNEAYKKDLEELIRPFEQKFFGDISLAVDYENDGQEMTVKLKSNYFDNFEKTYRFKFFSSDNLEYKRNEKRFLKIAVYRTLSFLTGVNLPYGCLTGIRPTKLYLEIEKEQDKYGKSARDVFAEDYSVSGKKIELIEKTVNVQRNLRNCNENSFDVFVFIPFCPSRCAYCTFVSSPIDKKRKLLEPYTNCLCMELEETRKLILDRNYKIRSVYIGGGTPTSLPLELLDKILTACHFGAQEFTVEAGRPDTISREVIALLKKHKVTRLSINPQTFNDDTLKKIGRNHTSNDIDVAYKLAKGKFDINMDLIAMLPDETFEDFKNTVDKAILYSPENITVHTLYLKKGSDLEHEGYDNADCELAGEMVDYAYRVLTENGYLPYYMYRQKYTSGNLENIGYAKLGKECIYNIDTMEEDTSILACGANAISKKWTKEINLIERNANFKEPLEYIKHFDTVLERKKNFWS